MGTKKVHFYLNPDLPMEQKIEDLLSKMTLEEKISQLKTRETHIWRRSLFNLSYGRGFCKGNSR